MSYWVKLSSQPLSPATSETLLTAQESTSAWPLPAARSTLILPAAAAIGLGISEVRPCLGLEYLPWPC